MVCTDDYLEWLQSIYILFGTKWSKIHCGPLWSSQPTDQNNTASHYGAIDSITVSDFNELLLRCRVAQVLRFLTTSNITLC